MSHTLCNGMSHCHASRWMTARRACSSQQPNAPHRIHLLVLVPGTGTWYQYTVSIPLYPSIPYIEIIIHHTIIHHYQVPNNKSLHPKQAPTRKQHDVDRILLIVETGRSMERRRRRRKRRRCPNDDDTNLFTPNDAIIITSTPRSTSATNTTSRLPASRSHRPNTPATTLVE